jgi:hypothetical protein
MADRIAEKEVHAETLRKRSYQVAEEPFELVDFVATHLQKAEKPPEAMVRLGLVERAEALPRDWQRFQGAKGLSALALSLAVQQHQEVQVPQPLYSERMFLQNFVQ